MGSGCPESTLLRLQRWSGRGKRAGAGPCRGLWCGRGISRAQNLCVRLEGASASLELNQTRPDAPKSQGPGGAGRPRDPGKELEGWCLSWREEKSKTDSLAMPGPHPLPGGPLRAPDGVGRRQSGPPCRAGSGPVSFSATPRTVGPGKACRAGLAPRACWLSADGRLCVQHGGGRRWRPRGREQPVAVPRSRGACHSFTVERAVLLLRLERAVAPAPPATSPAAC